MKSLIYCLCSKLYILKSDILLCQEGENAIIRNQYNRISHTSEDTTRETNTNHTNSQDGINKTQHTEAESQGVSSFQANVHQAILNIINGQRLTGSGRTNTIKINHNRSAALERSVINYWELKPVFLCSNPRPRFCCGSLQISQNKIRNNKNTTN